MSPITSSLTAESAADVLSFLAALDEPEAPAPAWTPRVIEGGLCTVVADQVATVSAGLDAAVTATPDQDPKYQSNYEKTTGAKYDNDLDVVDVAKLVRADIKTWLAANPTYKGTKVAVTIERYSMGCSLRLKVKSMPFSVYTEEGLRGIVQHSGGEYTPETRHLLDELERMGAVYQQKEVESQTDYYQTNFHLSVDLHWELTSAEVNAYRAKHKALA